MKYSKPQAYSIIRMDVIGNGCSPKFSTTPVNCRA